MDPGSGMLLEDFGQRVDLTRRIREVLANYPEGTTALRELIQNADDAGASRVRLCLDRRSHGTASLLAPALAQWQGPALLAYNDAVFTNEDFASISRIGDSRKVAQTWKTGRFGVGFNSVYHLTDLPSFVSGKYVVVFDPQGAYLPNVSSANPGKRIDYVSSSAIAMYMDQLSPYRAFGCDMQAPFQGTLFRFPLRSVEQASSSRLSRQSYTEDDILSLFVQLYEEAVYNLLFLKNVLSLEMYVWETGMTEPKILYSCSLGSQDKNLSSHRQALIRFSGTSADSSKQKLDSFSVDFVSEAYLGNKFERKSYTYFIVQGMASALSKIGTFATAAAKEYDLHLLPWASIAACISSIGPEDTIPRQGRAFCFLPLPVRTGLSVHVNGYFEVSSNRRDIWFGADMDRGGKLRSDWNRLLLEDVIALLFRELLLELRMVSDSTSSYYSLWPTGIYEEPWSILVKQIYKVIYSYPVLHSEIKGGAWISPADALLHDEGFSRSNDLKEPLVLLGVPVVRLPNVIVDMFSKFYTKSMLKIVSPATVRNLLKDFGKLDKLGKSHRLVLLEYCLLDLEPDSADIGKCMNGLPLIPLANVQFGIFSERSLGDHYYICDNMEYELLSGVGDRIVDRNIPPALLNKLYQIARNSQANITLINGSIFLQLFPSLFPPGWKYLNKVPWNPGLGGSTPTAAWFKLFWQYIGKRSYDLDLFSDWPILPSTSGHLHRSSTGSKLIKTGSLSSLMNGLLSKLGCKILDTEYLSDHHQLSRYVYDGNAIGVLHAIFEIISVEGVELQSLFQRITPGERNELYQFLLDTKWYLGGSISDMSINQCKKLPIFRVFDGGSPSSYGFSDLSSSRKYLPPLGVPDYLLNADFIFCICASDEDIMMRYYAVERMPKSNFYRRYVLNRLDELQAELRDSVLLTILQDLPQLSLEDPMFKEALKVLKFVPTLNGTLKSPQSLYDPRVEELYILLQESDCFPHGSFQNPDILDMLLCLGLRTSVSTDTIIQSAQQIDSLVNIDQQKAHSRGKVLLSYLEVHAHKWYVNKPSDGWKRVNMLAKVTTALRSRDKSGEFDLEKFWSDLRMICWCPVLVTAPSPALPWPSVSSMIAPPKQVRMQEDMWIVSASSRILDGECNSSALSYSLGWSSPPSGSVIAAQLLELGKNNEIVTDRILRQELALVMPKIYSLLTNLIGSDEMDIVKVVLEGCRWIWVGDGFAKVDEVVLSGHLHLAPYIRVVPIDLAVFKDLFLDLGIKEHLHPVDYAGILSRMAIRKASASLDAEELRTAVLLVQHLSEFRFQDQPTQIYLPDSSARLCLSSELVFNDAPWLLDFGNDITGGASSLALSSKHVHKFVHGNISNDVAERLGVRSLRRLLLAESSDSMNLSLSGVAEAFGQHEDLTTRLKHIVEMYADGPGILFELVQNAEDAKASEVVFLLDKTQYGTSSILSPEMAEWQGPALYCFNDSVFSPQDLYAISRIGQDSKLEKPFAIGRFGLGFNCVYHFTDIPGFVSGENIVMFDPHACYLPGISPSHPGLRIKFVGRRILEQFPDQFTPFLHFGCNLQQPFPGTLFRFPLRNEAAASRSQIKREKYAPQDVEILFSSFSEVVSEALLFLRNVKKITLYVKENNQEEMRLVHHVSKHNSPQIAKEPHTLNTMLEFIRGNRSSGMDRNQFFSKLNKTKDSDLPWSCQKVAILEQNPTSDMVHLWILAECIGGGHARKLSTACGSKSHFFVPWASVAAYLHSVNVEDTKAPSEEAEANHDISVFRILELGSLQNRKKFEGRAFCFLPLPINTSIPVHVNAYFELSSNRRDIWIGNDMTGGGRIRSEWNLALLEDVVAPAYGHLLGAIAEELGPSDLFLSFWPSAVGIEPWSSMVRKLYVSIAELGLNVLYTKARGGHWVSTRQAIFPDFSFSKASELTEVLSQAGLPMVSVPKTVVDCFINAYPSVHLLNPQLLRNLLIRRKRGFRGREEAILVLEYCLSDIGDPSFDKLQGLSLLPLANGSFTTFNKRGEGERVFFTSQVEFDLLKDSVPHLVIDNSLPDGILKKMYDIAYSARLNMYLFTCNFLLELFPRILPPEWQHANQLSWSPEQQGQPSVEWMMSLWKFLRHSCEDISIFAKCPILPLVDGKIVQLGNASNVIRDGGWSENMYSLLQKLGCFFLRSDLQIEHPQLANFVQESTAAGVLNAVQSVASNFEDVKELFVSTSLAETHELRSFIFQSKWFSGDQITSAHMNTISNLPIFESYKSRELVNLENPRKWLKPEGVHEDLLNESFIRTESAREKSILVSYFDIREPQKAEFYKDHVLPRISEFLSQPAVVSAIIRDVKLLAENDNSIRASLSETPFVLAANGEWVQPSRLYDPRVPELHKLLHKETFFPSEKFMNSDIIELLAGFGLKRNLGFSTLLDMARSVSLMHNSGHDGFAHGQKLLTYLNLLEFKTSSTEDRETFHKDENPEATEISENLDLEAENIEEGCDQIETSISLFSNFEYDIPEDKFWSELKNISWCPVHVAPLLKGLPWFISEDNVAPPVITRPKSQMWLVSSKMRILSAESFSVHVQRKLGWCDPPSVNILSSQLVELSKSYDELKMFSADTDIDAVLQKEIQIIYSRLQDVIGSTDANILKENLDGLPWIYVGDRFVPPEALAFDSPVKYHPYLYAVPSELSEFKQLLSELGVRQTFDAADYLNVLRRLQGDVKGEPLSSEQLSFVHCVLEAFVDCYNDNQAPDVLLNSLVVPDSFGVLSSARNLVYNDAPWINADSTSQNFVHPSIGNDIAKRLGVRSLRGSSLLDDELMRDLPCMEYAKISEFLALYGESDFLLFDLLELADYCNAKKVHLIYDKREHPKQSLLQQSLGDIQGSSLTVVFEGTIMTREEVCSLQLPPPWKLRGNSLNYGLGLLSSYFVCDTLTILSGGYFYIFDPLGLTGGASSTATSSARFFSLIGNDLVERFHDQFIPMRVTQDASLSAANSTVIRMPLSSKCLKELEADCNRVKQIFDRFTQNPSSTLLFLKSVLQVSLSTWEVGAPQPTLNYSVLIDPSSASLRNPFSEKKWRKFQISRIFASTSAAIKMQAVDIHVIESGCSYIDKWFVSLCLGSGQTRNMALDRRYLAYNLTPIAGVAAHIARNGVSSNINPSNCILSPLPLSGSISMPVTTVGHFLVRHSGGRYIFGGKHDSSLLELRNDRDRLVEAWNKELMLCVRDSYVEMVLEFQKLKKDPLSSAIETRSAESVSAILQTYGDRVYSFWPRSKQYPTSFTGHDSTTNLNSPRASKADWQSLVEQVIRPFYLRLADLPVWQLYRGNLVKVDEGMFLSHSGNGDDDNLPSASVCSFIKEHYPVFSVPWELVSEIQAVGVTIREIRPKMVRDLLKASSSILLRSIETYLDVLEYCFSDMDPYRFSELHIPDEKRVTSQHVETVNSSSSHSVPSSSSSLSYHSNNQTPGTSGGDALEIMTYFGKALYDFGRGVVEDISKTGGPISHRTQAAEHNVLSSIITELKGVPFPTSTKCLTRLGTAELWIANEEQQLLMSPLQDRFIHYKCLDKPFLALLLSTQVIHRPLKLRSFSPRLLSGYLRHILDARWIRFALGKTSSWIPWDNNAESTTEPSPKWIRSFWKIFSSLNGDLSLLSDWPLIPAYLDKPVLCRVKERHLIFVPPSDDSNTIGVSTDNIARQVDTADLPRDDTEESEQKTVLDTAFESMNSKYPWLPSLLNHLNVPIFDYSFPECGTVCNLFPSNSQTLGQTIVSKLVAAKPAAHLPSPLSLSSEDCDRLFELFVSEFRSSSNHLYQGEELDILRTLPMYKTVTGTYTSLLGSDHCILSPTAFFQPNNERCLSCSSNANIFLQSLGVEQLSDQEILVKFALPGFGNKTAQEQEDILTYLHANWKDLQLNSVVVETLKETSFVANANEFCEDFFKPKELLDPSDALLTSVFSGERNKFPAERFMSDGWLAILRKAGLRTSIEADMIVQCAIKIETMGHDIMSSLEDPDDFEADFSDSKNEIPFEIWSLAESVVGVIFANFATLYDNSFCEKIGKIAFVPAEKGFPSIGGKRGGRRVLASYNEAILSRDWPLAWSSAPILTKQAIVPPEYSWGAFRLRSPPAFSTVFKHLQIVGRGNGEDTLAHWPTSSGIMTVEDAFLRILQYLDKIWGAMSSSEKLELQKLAFIPVANGTRLVSVKSLFARLTINLSPFAFELPSRYLPFVALLREIGMQESLTNFYARELLLDIQKACGYQRLNPNELRAVMEILDFMCSGFNQNTSDGSEGCYDSVVPDDGCRLVSAASCVYVDPYGSHLLSNINTSRLRFAHPDLPQTICKGLGIKRLSDVIEEELDGKEEIKVVNNICSVTLDRIKQKMCSKSLQEALRIVMISINNHFPSFEALSLVQITRILEDISQNLQLVQRLHTRFLLLPNLQDITKTLQRPSIAEWSSNGMHRSICFVNKSTGRILVAEPPSFLTIHDVIAIVVSHRLGAPVILPIAALFACPDGSEKEVLNILHLGTDTGVSKREGKYDASLGTELLSQDARQVQFLPLRPFYSGEIVAWKTGIEGEKLRYGRVPEDVRPSAGQALYRFPVETALGETRMLLSSQVYSFRSVSMADLSSAPFQVDGGRVAGGGQDGLVSNNTRIEVEMADGLEYGKVSSTELVQAVHDMLSAAGVRMDAEKETLFETTLSLQDQLKESQVALLMEQEKAEAAAREADVAKAAWSCRICLNAEVNMTIIPCGHVLCNRCSSSVSRCPFCRTQVSRTMRIFRP